MTQQNMETLTTLYHNKKGKQPQQQYNIKTKRTIHNKNQTTTKNKTRKQTQSNNNIQT